MKRFVLAAAVLTALGNAGIASAQLFNGPRAGEEMATLHLKGGLIAPISTFDDADMGETSYASGPVYGASLTAWPALDRKLGVMVNILRGHTDGVSDYEWAPIVVNSPTIWLITTELAGRLPVGPGAPYVSLGAGMKQYTWVTASFQADRDFALTGSLGYDHRLPALGGLGFHTELRGYHTEYRAFGVNDGTFENAQMGGKIGGQQNVDLMFSTGLSVHF